MNYTTTNPYQEANRLDRESDYNMASFVLNDTIDDLRSTVNAFDSVEDESGALERLSEDIKQTAEVVAILEATQGPVDAYLLSRKDGKRHRDAARVLQEADVNDADFVSQLGLRIWNGTDADGIYDAVVSRIEEQEALKTQHQEAVALLLSAIDKEATLVDPSEQGSLSRNASEIMAYLAARGEGQDPKQATATLRGRIKEEIPYQKVKGNLSPSDYGDMLQEAAQQVATTSEAFWNGNVEF